MAAWLVAHDVVIQGLAAGTLLLFAGLAWWWSRDRHSLRELGTMSAKWLLSRDRFRNTAGK